jgi:ribosomal protein S18 acetylase RimI-like enzyme
MDMPEIMRLSYAEFKGRCDTEQCREELRAEIRSLFLPKMILNPFMGHSIIGLKKPGSKELLGFVDLSLQTQSLDALKPLPYILRVGKYGSVALRPYLCNLLVAPEYRRQGLGKRLVDKCIDTAMEWGHSELFLHVQETTPAPLNLYLKMGFERSLPAEGSYATLLRKSFPNRKAR